jgi:hypothetical protein
MNKLRTLSVATLSALALASTAFAEEPNGKAAPPNGAAAGAKPAAPTPGQPKPFKDVIKDAKAIPGYFPLYEKDGKVWMEVRPEQIGKPFFFSMNIPRSIGERGLYGSQMGGSFSEVEGSQIAMWKKIGDRLQLIAKNERFFANEGTPQAHFVAESFADSLISSAPVVSKPDEETHAVLIEANALLFGDLLSYGTNLEAAFRMPFALDAKNTSFSRVTNTADLTSLQVTALFAVPKLSAPPLTPPPKPMPPPPKTTPDPRNFFVAFQYNFMPLPDKPMAPRVADERLGHFVVERVDYTEDTSPKRRSYLVSRWRLEKKDPAAAVSEPKQPIVYWLDKNIPQKYRRSVADGILEWNKAFEKAGFKNAIVVKQQTEKDDFDTMDSRHASVRWFTGDDVGFAIGPSNADPRSGEILDADIGMSDVFARGARRLVSEDFARNFDELGAREEAAEAAYPQRAARGFLACNYASVAAREFWFAQDVLESRGLDMDSPEADALAQEYVKDVIMHEVGHTLGLQHNFRASTVYTLKQIQDKAFTRVNGITASVMDYTPFNLALKGQPQGEYGMSTLGPYDYWAIEYAYKQIDPAQEKAELAKIADRSNTEPVLAFSNDYDAGAGKFRGIDPDVNRFDLGADPLEYYRHRLALSRELWNRLETLKLAPDESYERLTRSYANAWRQLARVAPLAAKYVGGVKMRRVRPGAGVPIYEPTPAARQREALTMITKDFFHADSFKFRPEFVSRIGIDQFDRPDNPDISVAAPVLQVQKAILNELMSDSTAARLLDSRDKVADKAKAMSLSEVYDTLQDAIWSELKTGQDISGMRRNLQRDYLRRMAGALVKPSATTPADVGALQRLNATELQGRIRAALARKGAMSKEAQAHLTESLNTLTEALKAPLMRAGV